MKKNFMSGWFQNIRIANRIAGVMGLILVAVVALNVTVILGLKEINAKSKMSRDESLVFTLRAKAFQVSVIQVQQWLTDISATRAAEGYDDGYGEAEANYLEGLTYLDAFEEMFLEENDKEMIKLIKSIRESFAGFYEIGKDMAQAYIDYGPAQGNILMEKFDPYAEEIYSQVEILVGSQTEELNTSMNAIISTVESRTVLVISATVVLTLFILLVSATLSRSIIKPINLMVKGIEKLAANDLTVAVDVQSEDEIGVMARALNSSCSKIRNVIQKILASSGQVENAATQISSASEQLAAGAEEQQAQLSEVATTMEQMSAMILEASKNADETRQNAQLTGDTANQGREVVSKTVSGFQTVADTVEQAALQIQELNKRSEEIGKVIQVIDDIADQTNLLALNANIEAARAGDAGRGFAVVADEVRKLAERTVSATAEISKMIESIQGDIRAAVVSMEQIQGQSKDGLELVAQSDKSLEEIAGSIIGVVSAVEQIATSSNEQSSGAEEISKNIEGVSTVAKESASSAQELAASAEQLNKEVQGLNELIGQFKVE